MTSDSAIYKREDLLEIYKNPINMGSLTSPTNVCTVTNPMCGDVLRLEVLIEDGVIKDLKYTGDACAVAIISASLVTEDLIGKKIPEAINFTKAQVLDLIGVDLTTSRIKCATLILDALKKALKANE